MGGWRAGLGALVVVAVMAGCGGGLPGGLPSAPRSATPASPTTEAVVTPPPPSRTAAPPTPTSEPLAPTDPAPASAPATLRPIYDPDADPAVDIAAALAAARADGRPVLLDFGADWCPDCVVLNRMLERPEFVAWLATVHVIRIDVGYWDHNLDVAAQYGNPIATGIPAVVLLSPDGAVLGSTADGRLASASLMEPAAVLAILQALGG